MASTLERESVGMIFSLAKKHGIFLKCDATAPLPPATKLDPDTKGRSLTKDEKDRVIIPDGVTVKLISKYNDVTKQGLELVGPKTVKAFSEALQKAWSPKLFKEGEVMTQFVHDKTDHGVHYYTVKIE